LTKLHGIYANGFLGQAYGHRIGKISYLVLVHLARNSERYKSQAISQGLDQKSKMEEVMPKMTHRKGSDSG